MSFDVRGTMQAVAAHGAVARLVVAGVAGSAPRDAGAAMLVWAGGQSGTIGGGALEWEAVSRARSMIGQVMARHDDGAATAVGQASAATAADMLRARGLAARNHEGRSDSAPALDAPHQDTPGLHAPGLHAPGLHAAERGATDPNGADAASFGRAIAGRVDRLALGPSLGQCCGGAVTLITEVWDAASLASLWVSSGVVARAVDPEAPADMPIDVRRLISAARAEGLMPVSRLVGGWMVEPVSRASREVWVWGAGHVGRAVVDVLAPLPDLAIHWADFAADRFGGIVAPHVEVRIAANPADLVGDSAKGPGKDAEHLIVTCSHALDLELCHRLLRHGFGACGLIGSQTKRARFRARLAALGHAEVRIAQIRCPIGDPALGKHPQAIAVGVAAQMLRLGDVSGRKAAAGFCGGASGTGRDNAPGKNDPGDPGDIGGAVGKARG